MGNLLVLCTVAEMHYSKEASILKEDQVLKVMKIDDGKIMEFRTPIIVRDLLANYPNSYVGMFKEATQPLPLDYKLKIGKLYYLLPSLADTNNISRVKGAAKRIKVVLTKDQLQQLIAKQGRLQEVLLGVARTSKTVCHLDDGSSSSWLPKLESIPEGNELVC